MVALAGTMVICLLAIIGSVFAGSSTQNIKKSWIVTDTFNLADIKEPPPPPVVPPPPRKALRQLETVKFTAPKIVNTVVTEPPPSVNDMENVAIGNANIDGDKIDGIQPPLELHNTGAKEIKADDAPAGPVIVQVQASFPGGADAWVKYLERNLRQNIPVDNGAPAGDYKVIVSFIVSADGSLSDVKAENDPGYGIAAEAIRVIQKSGKWMPAIQNGRHVTYRQQQPITFRVSDSQ